MGAKSHLEIENKMNRLSKCLKGARVFAERRGGIYSRLAKSFVSAVTADMLKPRTDPFTSQAVLVIFVFFQLFNLLGDARAKELVTRLEGEATWKLHRVDGGVQWTSTNSFLVLVSAEGWRIEHVPVDRRTSPSLIAGSDNLDTYQILNNDRLAGISAKVSGQAVTNSLTQIGSVCRGIYPSDASKEVQVLWMAFIYPRCLTNEMLPKVVELSGIGYCVSRDARFAAEVDKYGDLKQAEYFSVGEAMYDKQVVHLLAPWDKGYVLWNLKSATPSNAEKDGIATSLFFHQNLPISPTNILRQWTADILVRSITTAEASGSNTFLPNFTNRSLATFDYRFSPGGRSAKPGESVQLTMYYSSKGQWLNRDQAELYNKGYREVRRDASPPEQISGHQRLVVIGLLGLLSIIALVMVWKAKTK